MWLMRRGVFAVRVIVCHWSRMRPVLSVSGKNGRDTPSERQCVGTMRALRSGVKKPPLEKNRVSLDGARDGCGHWNGASAS